MVEGVPAAACLHFLLTLYFKQQDTRSAEARGTRGSFDSPPWAPLDTPYPLQTTRVATLDPGMQLFLCFPKDTGLNQTCFLVGLPEGVIL